MRGNNILISLALLLAFVAGISAQEKTVGKEISIDKLLRIEEFTTLRFLISTKEEVKNLFGNECHYVICNYNDDWGIRFDFAGDILHFYLSNPIDYLLNSSAKKMKDDRTWVKPEFKGTLTAIELSHTAYKVLPENYNLPPGFVCSSLHGWTYCNNGETFIGYEDKGDNRKWIRYIHYRVSISEYKKITGETELQKTPPQQKNIPPKEPRY